MRSRHVLRHAFAIASMLLAAPAANALLFRAYVSPTGDDANACTIAAPCRLLPAAIAAVQTGGEIWILGSANYNTAPVQVNKAVSILAVPGVVGSVVATNGPAMSVTSGPVALNNLVFTPLPGGNATNGLEVNAPNATVVIEDCTFANLPQNGMTVTGNPLAPVAVSLVNSTFRNNGGSGVLVGDSARVSIAGGRFHYNIDAGVTATATVQRFSDVAITSSVFVGTGVTATTTGGSALVALNKSSVSHASTGLQSIVNGTGTARITLADTHVVRGFTAFVASGGGTITTLGNNNLIDNSTVGGSGSILTVPATQLQ